jgi:hypothetical protein
MEAGKIKAGNQNLETHISRKKNCGSQTIGLKDGD